MGQQSFEACGEAQAMFGKDIVIYYAEGAYIFLESEDCQEFWALQCENIEFVPDGRVNRFYGTDCPFAKIIVSTFEGKVDAIIIKVKNRDMYLTDFWKA